MRSGIWAAARRWRLGAAFLAAGTAGMLASGGVASAAGFTVTTTTDSNDGACTASLCSLRDAIVAADAAGGSSTITVPAGTYKLTIPSTGSDDPTTGDLDIDNGASVTISGAGSGQTVIDANNIDRAFAVQNGAGLTLSGLTIKNGNPAADSSGSQDGGAIYSDGALQISGDVVFKDNSAVNGGEEGGAIYADADAGSTLDVSGATFSDNNTFGGGAIDADQPGTATIQNSTFVDNRASDISGGGAIVGANGSMTIDASSFTGNYAAYGGAIDWENETDLTVTGSSFTGNTSTDYGGAIDDYYSAATTLDSDRFVGNVAFDGGALDLDAVASTAYTLDGDEFDDNTAIYAGAVDWEYGTLSSSGSSFIDNVGYQQAGALYANSGEALSLTNATIAGNTAFQGGGIYYDTSTPTSLTNDTIAYNSATSSGGGGIYDPGYATTGAGPTGVLNTIVADNQGGDCGGDAGYAGFPSAVDSGHNLDSDSSCFGGDASSDQLGVDPLLAQPADNGGTVMTDRLLPGSPAIDAGDSSACPTTDARGISRPQGSGCDIGAYEVAAAQLSLASDAPASGTPQVPFTDTITVSSTGPGPSTGTTVTAQLPAGETLYGATPSQGSCSSAGSPAKVTCELGMIAAGDKATVTLVVAEANPGTVTNTATAGNDEGASVSASATTSLASPAGGGSGTTGGGAASGAGSGAAPVSGGSAPAAGGVAASNPATVTKRPTAITGRSSHRTKHGVMLSGRVATGGQSTVYFFQYGRTRRLGEATKLVRAATSRQVKARIGQLLAGKKYYYRLMAANSTGTSHGSIRSFTTAKANSTAKAKNQHKKSHR